MKPGHKQQTLRLFYTTSCSYITLTMFQCRENPLYLIFFCCTYIIYKKTTSIFQTMVCKQFLSKLSLVGTNKSCINTMENTETASVQWIIIYRTYQVTEALDVWHCILTCHGTGSLACLQYHMFPLQPFHLHFLEMQICSSLPRRKNRKAINVSKYNNGLLDDF